MSHPQDSEAKRAAIARAAPQLIIARDFADQINEAKSRLCLNDCLRWTTLCEVGLLPLTTKGEDCPYFQRP